MWFHGALPLPTGSERDWGRPGLLSRGEPVRRADWWTVRPGRSAFEGIELRRDCIVAATDRKEFTKIARSREGVASVPVGG